jgi:hypothetical protein
MSAELERTNHEAKPSIAHVKESLCKLLAYAFKSAGSRQVGGATAIS